MPDKPYISDLKMEQCMRPLHDMANDALNRGVEGIDSIFVATGVEAVRGEGGRVILEFYLGAEAMGDTVYDEFIAFTFPGIMTSYKETAVTHHFRDYMTGDEVEEPFDVRVIEGVVPGIVRGEKRRFDSDIRKWKLANRLGLSHLGLPAAPGSNIK